MYLKAIDEYGEAIDLFGPNTGLLSSPGYVLAQSGQRMQAEEILNQLPTDLAIL